MQLDLLIENQWKCRLIVLENKCDNIYSICLIKFCLMSYR